MAAATELEIPQNVDAVVRPLGSFTPDTWGDRFDHFTPEQKLKMERYEEEVRPLKEEVRVMLLDHSLNIAEKMRMIDAVERLGFSYYYEKEIDLLVNQSFQELVRNNFNVEYGLSDTASQFRIFRQYGFKIPCDVFMKFTDGKGKFKDILKSDVKGMLNLYEAAFLRVRDEPIMEEALVFTTDFLKSIATFSEQARWALDQPVHRGNQRLLSRRFISAYEEDESRNEKLLQLAKIEYNRMQLMYCQELSHIQMWRKSYDLEVKAPYFRPRSMECHLWALITYYGPQHSVARILLSKFIFVILILDDAYDRYGTFEELQQLTNAFHKWDLNLVEQFPQDYMKFLYKFVITNIDELIEKLNEDGKQHGTLFVKEQVLLLIRNYSLESKWVKLEYVPTFEEYMVNGKITTCAQVITTAALILIEEAAQVKPYIQILQAPTAIGACEDIGRLMDDLVTGEAELARRVRLASSVECYMKDHNMSKDKVLEVFKEMIEDKYKILVNEGLLVNDTSDDYDHFSKLVYDLIFNFARSTYVFYRDRDGFTFPEVAVNQDMIASYAEPVPV